MFVKMNVWTNVRYLTKPKKTEPIWKKLDLGFQKNRSVFRRKPAAAAATSSATGLVPATVSGSGGRAPVGVAADGSETERRRRIGVGRGWRASAAYKAGGESGSKPAR